MLNCLILIRLESFWIFKGDSIMSDRIDDGKENLKKDRTYWDKYVRYAQICRAYYNITGKHLSDAKMKKDIHNVWIKR